MRRSRSLLLPLLAGLLSAAGTASAAPAISYWLGVGDTPTKIWGPTVEGTAVPGTSAEFSWADGGWTTNPSHAITWKDVRGDVDPGVSGVWSITNSTAVEQTYTFIIDLPVLPVAPSSLMFGSSTISVGDASFSGVATLSSAGVPIYRGRVDGAGVAAASLFSAPYTLSTPPSGLTTGDTQSFGIFPGSVPGPAVVTSIGIEHKFKLTAGDTATLNSTFFLQAVPEPGTLVLALSGLAGLGLIGRRRA